MTPPMWNSTVYLEGMAQAVVLHCVPGRYGQAVGLPVPGRYGPGCGIPLCTWKVWPRLWDSIVYLEGMARLWDCLYLEGMAQAVEFHSVPGRYGPGCGTPLCTWKVWPGCGTACTWKVWPRLWNSTLYLEGMAQAVGLHCVPGRYGQAVGLPLPARYAQAVGLHCVPGRYDPICGNACTWKVWPGCGTLLCTWKVWPRLWDSIVYLEGMARLWDCLYLEGMARLWDWKVWPGCGTGRNGQAVGLDGMARLWDWKVWPRLWDWKVWPGCGTGRYG